MSFGKLVADTVHIEAGQSVADSEEVEDLVEHMDQMVAVVVDLLVEDT
jgi:hypothetical protein